ncbi:hypothetical protein SAMN02745207_04219 [Clostridium grantii DSM 8605]|uniref:Uncharacterized protein n=2 Tax=Clostridium TaxID=1485 RepID=A0A1M5Y5N9_9CLOT|nr:hypothetical protein SAMN02745207_04219 [Clostridium grantii DSM 8605]
MRDEIGKMLQQILSELKELKSGQARIEEKLDSVYDHTVKSAEDITETNMKLVDQVIDDIDYLKHKEHKTEEDLYKLKKNLKIVK